MRGARPCGSRRGSTEKGGAVSARRNGTVKSIFTNVLAPRKVQRNDSGGSFVGDVFHQCAYEPAMILLFDAVVLTGEQNYRGQSFSFENSP